MNLHSVLDLIRAHTLLFFSVKSYSKTCVKQPLSKRPKLVFKTNYRLNTPTTRVCAFYRTPFGCYENLIRSDLFIYSSRMSIKQVKSIAECSKWNILQYCRLSLSYQLLLRSLFCQFLSGCFTQVLLYSKIFLKL